MTQDMTKEILAEHYHLVAPTAPHDCDVTDCPGPENKRKLAAFEELLGVLGKISEAPEGVYPDQDRGSI